MSIQSVERRWTSRSWCAEAVSLFLILMLALTFSVTRAATSTVTSLNDSGPDLLRQAMLDANVGLTTTQASTVSASFTIDSIPFDPTVASTISWFYAAAFSRTPVPHSTLPDYGDLGGLAFWTAAYLTGEGGLAPYLGNVYAIANFFVMSDEFQSRYSASLPNEAFVTALYENMLGRAPDAGGLAFWTSQLNAGASRGTVLADFTNTPENWDSNPLRKAAMQSFIAFLAANHGVVTPAQAAAWLAANPTLDGARVDEGCVEGQTIQVNGVDRYRVVDSDCSIVADLVTGLEWQRCSVGQTWNVGTQTCDGEAVSLTWDQALTQTAPGGFRPPTVEELRSLVYCSNKNIIGMYDNLEGCGEIRSFETPTIVHGAFPGTRRGAYWTSSPSGGTSGRSVAFSVGFYNGSVGGAYAHWNYAVRLVRSGQ